MSMSLKFAAIVAASLFATAAAAADQSAKSVALDRAALGDPEKAERALDAIERAALDVCRAENRHGAMSARGVRVCVADTVARAVQAVDAPALTRLHAGREAAVQLAERSRDGAR